MLRWFFGVAIVLVCFTLVQSATALGASPTGPWQNVCSSKDVYYCKHEGKTAYNAFGALKGVELGRIVGVAWRCKGCLVSKDGRTAPRAAYYYIIDDGAKGMPPFLRACREVNAR